MNKKAKFDIILSRDEHYNSIIDKTIIIDITEEIDYRYRIIEELATMAMERNPMLNVKEELKNVPYVFWAKEDLYDTEEEKIQEIFEIREEELHNILELILAKVLNVDLTKKFIWFGDNYHQTEDEKKENITIHWEIEICDKTN